MMPLKAQTRWGWLIASYLFLAGVGAGAYIAGVAADLAGWKTLSRIGVFIGFPCVFVGSMLLIADLGKPQNFWRAWMNPATSWIARGTIVICVFMVISAIHTAFWIWPFHGLEDAAGTRQFIGVLGALFALGTAIYTGILLGASRPIAFWSTPMLPMLFLVSALSTGIMAVILVASILGQTGNGLAVLENADVLLIVVEMLILAFYIQGAHRVYESRASAHAVVAGSLAAQFWAGVGLLGLVVPLALELLASAEAAAIAASICGLAGGLLLRKVILAAGIHAPLKAGRFEYGLANV